MTNKENPLVISFLTLRKAVGILGISFPFVLVIGSVLIANYNTIQDSISYYYHTNMRDVFVGVLCAVGLFLFSYTGYNTLDNITGKLACIFALGVAFLPCYDPLNPEANPLIGKMHLASASLLFLIFAFYSLVLFTRSNKPKKDRSQPKKNRDVIFKVCGYTILAAIAIIAVYKIWLRDIPSVAVLRPVFWLETIALLAFGTSWLVKGQMILKDA